MKVMVRMHLIYKDKVIENTSFGILKDDGEVLSFRDQTGVLMHFYFQNKLFIRDTEESILSYQLKEKGTLEIYLKAHRKSARVPLCTTVYQKRNHAFNVTYKIEGNDDFHELFIEWERIK